MKKWKNICIYYFFAILAIALFFYFGNKIGFLKYDGKLNSTEGLMPSIFFLIFIIIPANIFRKKNKNTS